jgi:hypothetical protein
LPPIPARAFACPLACRPAEHGGHPVRKNIQEGFEKREQQSLEGQAIKDFREAYDLDPKPFVRRKREVKGGRLRNTAINVWN